MATFLPDPVRRTFQGLHHFLVPHHHPWRVLRQGGAQFWGLEAEVGRQLWQPHPQRNRLLFIWQLGHFRDCSFGVDHCLPDHLQPCDLALRLELWPATTSSPQAWRLPPQHRRIFWSPFRCRWSGFCLALGQTFHRCDLRLGHPSSPTPSPCVRWRWCWRRWQWCRRSAEPFWVRPPSSSSTARAFTPTEQIWRIWRTSTWRTPGRLPGRTTGWRR